MVRVLFSLLFLFGATTVFAQLNLQWSTPIAVADSGGYDNIRPRIALTSGNKPVVLWGHPTDTYYTANWNGTGFNTPIAILPSGLQGISINSEGPEIAAHGDTVYVAFTSLPYAEGNAYIIRSTDGGATWGDTVRVADLGNGIALFAYVETDGDGNPMVTYMENDPGFTNPRYAFARSTDGGMTFLPQVNASVNSPADVCECCPSAVVASDSTVAVLYRNNDGNLRDIRVSVSETLGDTFPTEIDIDSSNWRINSCPATGPEAIIQGDSVLAVWMSRGSSRARVHYGTADMRTGQTGLSRKLFESGLNSEIQNYPQIAGRGDTLGIVWQASFNGLASYLLWSVSGTAGLTTVPVEISIPDGGNKFTPDVAFADGVFHFVYQNSNTNQTYYRYARIVLGTEVASPAFGDVKVFPNPATESLGIEWQPGDFPVATIRVTDLYGRVLLAMPANGSSRQSLALLGLAPGAYFVELTDVAGARHLQKFIKQ